MPVIPNPSEEAAYTVGYLIDRTFDLLLGAAREDMNRLTNGILPTDTSITVDFAAGRMNQGTYIAIDDEVMYVWSSTTGSSNSTAVVQRGMKGTLPASHAGGSLVKVNPFFAKYQVRRTLQDEIRSWGPQVFQVKTADIATTNFVRGYDLSALGKAFFVLDVQRSWNTVYGTPPTKSWPSVNFKMDKSANTTDFPSGTAIVVTDKIDVFDTPTLHVIYASPIDVDTTFGDTDSLITMGMDTSDLDIAPYGAAWRLASSREVRRMLVEAQGTAADIANFPPGYMVKMAEEFKQLRDSRLKDAIERLRAAYPLKRG